METRREAGLARVGYRLKLEQGIRLSRISAGVYVVGRRPTK